MRRPLDLAPESVPLPKGTRVVLLRDEEALGGRVVKAGTLCRVVEVGVPVHTVEDPAGHRVQVHRARLTVPSDRMQDHADEQAWAWDRMADHVVLDVVVGSVAWGLDDEHSDLDRKGAFLWPHALRDGLYDPPDELRPAGEEAQFVEVGKLVTMALRADANAFEILWTPHVLRMEAAGRRLRDARQGFVSKRIQGSFGRYALSQFEKMRRTQAQRHAEQLVADVVASKGALSEQALVAAVHAQGLGEDLQDARTMVQRVRRALYDRGLTSSRRHEDMVARLVDNPPAIEPFRPKNAYNLLRILHSGIRLARTGEPMIRVDDAPIAERLRAIKAGRVPLDEIEAEARELAVRFDEALHTSALPDDPDVDAAHRVLCACRELAARRHFQVSVAPPPVLPAPDRGRLTFDVDLRPAQARLAEVAQTHDVVLCALTGAHLYGFPSPDSDLDLKGLFLDPAATVLAHGPRDTVDDTVVREGVELDLTLMEAGHAVSLLVRGNGNLLEQLLGPATVWPTPDATSKALARLESLRALAAAGVHRGYLRHYRGFLRQTIAQHDKAPTIKGWLYSYRVGLTGTHLLRTGELVADVRPLAADRGWSHVAELVAAKAASDEHGGVASVASLGATVAADVARLEAELDDLATSSPLPEACPHTEDLRAWLVRWRTTAV